MRPYGLVVAAVMGAVLLAAPQGMAQGLVEGFRWCPGDFALCAASTCTRTGGQIDVRTAAGGTTLFDEAECTCPIFPGPGLADVKGGNMRDTCAPPTVVHGQPTDDGIWSWYLPTGHIPQAINHWSRGQKQTAAPIQVCGSGDVVNCFSFACVRAGKIHGVEVATCYCPINESLQGAAAGAPFFTPAGQCNQDTCSQLPVGAPFPPDTDPVQPGQCIPIG
jgi:hypothetical protein